MMLVGRTALSVETSTNRSTPQASAALGQDGGAERVVAQAGDRVVLDHRHVLVGGGVIDGLDRVALDGPVHQRAVLHRTEHGDDLRHSAGPQRRRRRVCRSSVDLELDLVELAPRALRAAPAAGGP